MKKLIVAGFAALLLVFSAGQVLAQQAMSPEKLALIKELLEVTGASENADKTADMMLSFQEKEAAKMVESLIEDDNNLSPDDKARMKEASTASMERMMTRVREFFAKEFNLGQSLGELVAPIYDKHFTESELREMIAFHKTPTGQKTIKIMPQLMMETMTAVSEKLMPKVNDFLKTITQDEFAKIKSEVTSKKKPVRKS